ncbi:all trans-polyprenyl-diphosphate synthase PDSS2-like [Ornithodoros turicata]
MKRIWHKSLGSLRCTPVSVQCFIGRSASTNIWPSTKSTDWNRAVSNAEKIVGYPTSYFSLRCLLNDETSNIAFHVRKLIGTNHPVLKTAKRLIYNGRTNIQTRGLIVLLLSKASGHPRKAGLEEERVAGITQRQRSLAEITEMIHTAHLIHRGILNLSNDLFPDATTLKDLQFGNKISVLTGDYLIANASKFLTDLKNCKVVDLVATAIGDFMQSEFIGDHDQQGHPIPYPGMTIQNWEEKNYLSTGSLMSNSCQATLELAGHEEKFQELGFEFGKSIGLAWQVHSDLQPFVDTYRNPPGLPFSLMSAPVILQLENDSSLLKEINYCRDNLEKLDYLKLHTCIMNGDGVEKAKALLESYTSRALAVLNRIPPSEATTALRNIIQALRE